MVTDVAAGDDLAAFGASAIVSLTDEIGAVYLATTRPVGRFAFATDEQLAPPALDEDPWSSLSIALRVGDVAVVVWAAAASPGALRVIAQGLRVDADALRPLDRSLTITGTLTAGWPGPGRATSVWAGPVRVVAVPVEPAEQHVLWAMMEAVHPVDDASPIEGFHAADYPALRDEAGGWFGTLSSGFAALVVAGEPGVALLASIDVERSDVDLGAMLRDLELIGPDEIEMRAQTLDSVLIQRESDDAASALGAPVLWNGYVHDVRRLLFGTDDVIGYDRVQRHGPAVCIVDIDVIRGLGAATASTCTDQRPSGLTASAIDTFALGNGESHSYFDVWGVASDSVSRVDVVLAGGEVVPASLARIVGAGWFFQVELGERAAIREVTAYGLSGDVVDRVTPGPDGDLPGFLVHPWK